MILTDLPCAVAAEILVEGDVRFRTVEPVAALTLGASDSDLEVLRVRSDQSHATTLRAGFDRTLFLTIRL